MNDGEADYDRIEITRAYIEHELALKREPLFTIRKDFEKLNPEQRIMFAWVVDLLWKVNRCGRFSPAKIAKARPDWESFIEDQAEISRKLGF